MLIKSWVSPKTIRAKSEISGLGLFALENIVQGEVVAVKAGHIVTEDILIKNKVLIRDNYDQITDELYLVPLNSEEDEQTLICLNHSCEPNLGVGGSAISVAMRAIKAGEELTHDYAMYLGNANFRLKCNCKRPNCRKIITGNDWQITQLQKRYKGYFAWYLSERIKKMTQSQI